MHFLQKVGLFVVIFSCYLTLGSIHRCIRWLSATCKFDWKFRPPNLSIPWGTGVPV